MLQHWGYDRTLDMSPFESEGQYLEGTGVLVIDRINGVAYVALSERADRRLAQVRRARVAAAWELCAVRCVCCVGATAQPVAAPGR